VLNAENVLASGVECWECVDSILSGVVEVRKETLEAQINRLAELIGRLENKVRTPILLKKSIVIKYKNDTKQKYKCNI
jgi:hypothetical protein